MAAFDSQAALTTNIISNLATVTETQAIQTNSSSINHGEVGKNLPTNLRSLTASSTKSAVPIVNRATTLDKGASSITPAAASW